MPASSGPTHEVRLGVVMYGGVSLAVYMSGVARELFNLVHASRVQPPPGAADARSSSAADAGGAAPAGSQGAARSPVRGDTLAAVYRQAIAAMDAHLGTAGGASRVSVDVIVGASAGGINGVYLAKALAVGAPPAAFDALRRLWFEQADITALVEGLGPRPHVESLFDGAFMYARLREALDDVDRASHAHGQTRAGLDARLAEQLSLVVTATDLGGVPVRIRLADRVAEERDHKHAFAFRRDGRGRDDFGSDANALLAFAARSTSSLPIAFPPVRVHDVAEQLAAAKRGALDDGDAPPWWRLFRRLREPDAPSHLRRVFTDGGYLDNKPFGHAIDQLGATSSGRRVTRKLLYVEPTPELDVRADVIDPPNALANAASAVTLARYETIRDDLARLTERNRLIDRLGTLTAGLEEDVARLGGTLRPVGRDPDYGERDLVELVGRSGLGPAYGAYHRLRVATTTDRLSDLVADHAGVAPESDHRLALRELVQRWRKEHFARNPGAGADGAGSATAAASTASTATATPRQPESAFLHTYDVDFRVRRARFVLAKLDHLAHLSDDTLAQLQHYRTMPAFAAIDSVLERYENGADGVAAARAAWLPVAAALADVRARCQGALGRLQQGLEAAVTAAATSAAAGAATDPTAAGATRGAPARATSTTDAGDVDRELDAILRAPTEREAGSTPSASTDLALLQEAVTTSVRDQVAAFDAAFEAAFDAGAASGAPHGGDGLVDEVLTLAQSSYSEGFERYDAIEFPLVEAAGLVGERAPVEVYRVSPADATLLFEAPAGTETPDDGEAPGGTAASGDGEAAAGRARERAREGKLFGVRLGNFGAFFDRRWRENDLLWGRLDGAERLIASLLPGADHEKDRHELTLEALRAIVCEELPEVDRSEVARLDGAGLLAVIERAHPRDQAPSAATVVHQSARVARTATALLRRLQPQLFGTNALLRGVGGLILLVLWAVKAQPWTFVALGLVALALSVVVASLARLTLWSVLASAFTLAGLLVVGGVALGWLFRRRLLAWLGEQLGSADG